MSKFSSNLQKALYELSATDEKTDCASQEQPTTRPVEGTAKNENAVYEIKRVARINMMLGICKWLPVLLIVLLFTLPLIRIDIGLGELVLESYKVSVFDFIFSHADGQTFRDAMLAEMTAEFLGVDSGSYNNFSAIFFAGFNNLGGDVEGFVGVLKIIGEMVLGYFLPVGSIFVIVVYAIAALIGIFKHIKKSMVETALRRVDEDTFVRVFGEASQKGNNKAAMVEFKFMMFGLMIKYFIGVLIAVVFFAYLPTQLISFLANHVSVTVSPLWYIAYWGLFAMHVAFLVAEYFYSKKKAKVLNGCEYINAIV